MSALKFILAFFFGLACIAGTIYAFSLVLSGMFPEAMLMSMCTLGLAAVAATIEKSR